MADPLDSIPEGMLAHSPRYATRLRSGMGKRKRFTPYKNEMKRLRKIESSKVH
jgi:hypothetical protein